MKTAPYLLNLLAAVLLESGTARAATVATPFVMDLAGDGIDLGGQTTTSLFGTVQKVHWTKPSSDDAFLVVDATSLRSKGYDLRTQAGATLFGPQLVRGGTRLRVPGGKAVPVTDAWAFLVQLDANADGQLTQSDAVWPDLSLFVDSDADGKLESSELLDMPVSGVASVSLVHARPTQDRHGNVFANGTYRTASGATRLAAGVMLTPAK